MLAILFNLILLALAWFYPAIIAAVVTSIAAFFVLQVLVSRIGVAPNPKRFTPEEIRLLRKYRLFFQFPFGARSISAFLSGMQFFVAIPILGFLVYHGDYMLTFLPAATFFMCWYLRPNMDPVFFLSEALERSGDIKSQLIFARELETIGSIQEKLDPRNYQEDDE